MADIPHVMVDLETFGTGPDAVIISIGAVKFSAKKGIIDRFHTAVDPNSSVALCGKLDVSTVLWWCSPEQDEARRAWQALQQIDLASALEGFASWFGSDSLPLWGNGATFDNVILRRAYTNAHMAPPWKFSHDRCYRTLKSLAPDIKISFEGLSKHSALDDAVAQTKHLLAIVEALEINLN